MDIIENLNDPQKEAVITTEGPVMVMAGAGSGKTRVLTHRIAYIISFLGISPYNILAVTFTNKAAREMKERVNKLTSLDVRNMWISTFHSFCAKLLRIELDDFMGYKKDFTIIDEEDALKIIREIMKEQNIDQKEIKPKWIKSLISNEKNLEPVCIENPYNDRIYHDILDKYNQRLKRENLLDFDDLILITTKLFEEKKDVLEKYQEKFKYIMVDEFQDTNLLQYKLIKLLAKHQNIFIVGDQDQSIYSFRGAKVENIDRFLVDFKNTKTILLEENYRSTNAILKIANNVISNNTNRIKKNLFTSNQGDVKPAYYHADSAYDEVMYVIDKIKELYVAGYRYSDFAILYRANSLSRQFEDMLIKYQIPYVIYGGLSFFERKEIKDIISYLRLIINNDDDFSFKRIVNEPKRKIGDALLDKLRAKTDVNTSLFKAIDLIETSGIGYNNLLGFKFTIIELYEDLLNMEMPFINIIDKIIEKTGYKEMLNNEGEEGKERLDNIKELKTVLKEAEEFYEGDRIEILRQLMSDLALRTDTDNKDETDDCVKLMTYHQAKGLEYRAVFMVAMEQGIFPSINSLTSAEQEEERRICYVGITRAKERLYITNASSRFLYGNQNSQAPSIYIKEMGKDDLNIIGKTVRTINLDSNSNKKEEKEVKQQEIVVGDKINHKAFGDGMVVEKNNNVITVAFNEPYGIKKLIANHPSIRKI